MNKEIIKILNKLLEIPQSTNGEINFYSIESNKFEAIITLIKKQLEDLQHQLEEKEQQMNIMSEAFDELEHQKQDYTQINILEMKLKEKDKVIDEAIKYINDNLIISSILDNKTTYCLNSYGFSYEELLEILERGKNVNSK